MGVCQYQMFGNMQGFVTIFCLVGERPTLMVLHHHSSLNTSRASVIPVCRRRNLEDAAELEGVHRPWKRDHDIHETRKPSLFSEALPVESVAQRGHDLYPGPASVACVSAWVRDGASEREE